MSLITAALARTHLGVAESDIGDTTLDAMIAAAQKAMERYAGRNLASVSRTEQIDGTGKRSVFLAEPAESVTTVHVSSSRVFDATTLINSDDYHLDACRLEYLDSVWLQGQRNVQVVYLAGFAVTPADVAYACKQQVAAYYAKWQRTKAGLDLASVEQQEAWSRSFDFRVRVELCQEARDVLENYGPGRL